MRKLFVLVSLLLWRTCLAAAEDDVSPGEGRDTAPTQTLSDNFDDGSLDTTLWTSDGTVVEQSGVLALSAMNNQSSNVQTKTKLMGADQDVEVSVDYADLAGLGTGGVFLYLIQEDYNRYGLIELYGTAPLHAYFSFYSPGGTNFHDVSLSGATGKLKLVHHYATGVLEGLVDEGAGWTSAGDSGSLGLDPSLGFYCWLEVYGTSTSMATEASFDNFYARGGQYVPPQLGEKGLFERYTYYVGSDQRDVRMVVPSNYDPHRPIGILYGFHGSLGGTPQPDPYLMHLAYSGYESRAAQGYFITASLANRKGTDGWSGGWTNNNLTSDNPDAQAVSTLCDILKAHYAIDDDRIFITGFSSGGGFCLSLPYCLPNFIAASSPECPVPEHLPPTGAVHACIGTGGLTDSYNTAPRMQNLTNWHKTNGTDADCYIFDMPHSGPPPDPTVTPSRYWEDIALEYFLTHPRYYTTYHYPPPFYADDCLEEFSGPAAVPNAVDWRVELFDGDGVLYGPIKQNGSPGSGVYGYKFRIQDGWLHSDPVGTGLQGGMCCGRFLRRPSVWEMAFVVDAGGADLIVWPAILRDMSGRTVALRLTPTGWAWQAADTHLALRADYAPSLHTLATGSFSLTTGAKYSVRVSFDSMQLSWELRNEAGALLDGGTLSAAQVGLRDAEFALGLRGTTASVKFDYAHMESLALSAVEPSAWTAYK